MVDSPWSFFSPFSQNIGRFDNEPVTDWAHFFSLSTIFNENPGDKAVESHVVSKVGSYGKQLSTIIDMIDALAHQAGGKALTSEHGAAITAFDKLKTDAQTAVNEFRASLSPDDIFGAATSLGRHNPTEAAALLERLTAALKPG